MVRIRPRKSQHEGRSSLAVSRVGLREMENRKEPPSENEEESSKTPEKKILWSFLQKTSEDTALSVAKRLLKKKFMLFRDEDIIWNKRLLYPIWRVRFETGGKRVGLLYVDGLSGEITFGKDLSHQSRNIKAMESLGQADRRLLSVISSYGINGAELNAICRKVGLDEKTASRRISELVKKGFVQSKSGKKNRDGDATRYSLREKFASMPSIDEASKHNFAFQKAGEDVARLMKPCVGMDDLKKALAIYEGASLLEADVVYKPVWVFKTDRKRHIVVDGLSGKNDEVAAGRMPKGV
jgi:hypothetical protein